MTNPDDPEAFPEAPLPETPGDPGEAPAGEEAPPPKEAGGAEPPLPTEATAEVEEVEEVEAEEESAPRPSPAAVTVTGRAGAPVPRPDLLDRQEPLYRSCAGYRLRLEPPDLARLRELPGARGKSDQELGETFFDGQAERLAASVAGDVPSGAELRVVVDPYSRQAFVALENRIRGILSF